MTSHVHGRTASSMCDWCPRPERKRAPTFKSPSDRPRMIEPVVTDELGEWEAPHSYREVDESAVAPAVVEDVRLALGVTMAALPDDLRPDIDIRWFVEAPARLADFAVDAGVGGFVDPKGAIWLKADRPAPSVARTALHELCHAAQRLAGFVAESGDNRVAEDQAAEFADRMAWW